MVEGDEGRIKAAVGGMAGVDDVVDEDVGKGAGRPAELYGWCPSCLLRR